MTKTNLNPKNYKDIKDLLDNKNADRLWFFLDDSIPRPSHDEMLLKMGNNWISSVCFLTDICFFQEDSKNFGPKWENQYKTLLKNGYFTKMEGYIPLLKDCYVPYDYSVFPKPITEEQNAMLNKLSNDGVCMISLEKENDWDVPVDISLSYTGHRYATTAYMKSTPENKKDLKDLEKYKTTRCQDKDIALKILDKCGNTCSDLSSSGIGYYSFIENKFPEMMEFISESDCMYDDYLGGDPFVFFLSENLLNDKDIIMALVKYGHFDYPDEHLLESGILEDEDLAVEIGGKYSEIAKVLPERFLADKDFIIKSLNYGSGCLYYLKNELKNDNDIRFNVVEKFGIFKAKGLFMNKGKINLKEFKKFENLYECQIAKIVYFCNISHKEAKELLDSGKTKEILKMIKESFKNEKKYFYLYDFPNIAFSNKTILKKIIKESSYNKKELLEKIPEKFKNDEAIIKLIDER